MDFFEGQRQFFKSHAAGLCCCWACIGERKENAPIMIVCPTCGNKRCPKASNHTLACTNSNTPGQRGSIYR
jgi:hypothetical protein